MGRDLPLLLLPTASHCPPIPQKGAAQADQGMHAESGHTTWGDGKSGSVLRPRRATTVLALLQLPTASSGTPPIPRKEAPKQLRARNPNQDMQLGWWPGLTSDQDMQPPFSPCSPCQLPLLAPPVPQKRAAHNISKHVRRIRTCNLGDGRVVANPTFWSDLRPGHATTVLPLLPAPTASSCPPPNSRKGAAQANQGMHAEPGHATWGMER
jgi:hypothetical protein